VRNRNRRGSGRPQLGGEYVLQCGLDAGRCLLLKKEAPDEWRSTHPGQQRLVNCPRNIVAPSRPGLVELIAFTT